VLAEGIHVVTLRPCAVTDSMSCGGETVIGKIECAAYVGRLEGNLASLSPEERQ
jgi:hypothetical protein